MVRTQVQLTERDLTALQEMAAESGVSVSELVRRGVKCVLEGRVKPTREELIAAAMATAGIGHSGVRDLGREHDRYFAEAAEE